METMDVRCLDRVKSLNKEAQLSDATPKKSLHPRLVASLDKTVKENAPVWRELAKP
jgi:hypothetical protein